VKHNHSPPRDEIVDPDRRDFLRTVASGAVASAFAGSLAAGASYVSQSVNAQPASPEPYNILLFVTDQERYFRRGELPSGYRLAARERLAKNGVVFENHRINSCVCTPSRSVLYTGRHIQQTRMFDNTNFPWIQSLSTEIKTIGHLLREAGYYTAYKGKWHLTKEFETVNELETPERIFTKEMEAYGFSDYLGIGDVIAHTQGGYLHDGVICAMAVNWLRGRAAELAEQRKPWFLAVNLVNPHDVMFYNTDRPGEPVQERDILGRISREPDHPLYAQRWPFELPTSFSQALDAPGRPRAHADFIKSHDRLVGRIAPGDEWRWRNRHNFYLNCLRDADRHVMDVLDELDARGLASSTIVILTADHGDLDGAHRLHAKGATSYREQNHVPLIVTHPAFAGGKRCKAVTSHVDLAPTLVALTNASADKKAAISRGLPGRDFSALLAAPDKAGADAVRDGQLFCYNMFAYLDGDFMEKAAQYLLQPNGGQRMREAGLQPDVMKRGAIRSVFDGRYQLSRYFSPKQHNRPTSLESLLRLNDVELFDLDADPHELHNLAGDPAHNELLVAMNAKLNALLDAEVGEDVGQMLPGGVDAGWVATPAVRDM
jgi:arylsulfatase